ncbi:MAG: formylglycine-generating enzyme family protein [candidate division KSB1 bacterium]|nr:formylglycine-generating enzyme family protein [candidate division KSB1 bacterium]MDZ7365988.1 formylglycine-generating enzyme family protein [candidate division KSB1 bacterium]MDZ7404105.1 formylglycine-generating enzyme family protein [candidate division KSB1 bacterium]
MSKPCLWRAEDFNLPNQPVIGMWWFEAEAFCNWLTEQLASGKSASLQVRLPTEAEWEFAARGKEGRKFPWQTPAGGKDEPTPEHANYNQSQIGRLAAVGTYRLGATPEGIFDLAGNMWEWCLNWYDEKYYAECKKKGVVKNPAGPQKGLFHVLRGGAYWNKAEWLRAAFRFWGFPDVGNVDWGFRVVASAES